MYILTFHYIAQAALELAEILLYLQPSCFGSILCVYYHGQLKSISILNTDDESNYLSVVLFLRFSISQLCMILGIDFSDMFLVGFQRILIFIVFLDDPSEDV